MKHIPICDPGQLCVNAYGDSTCGSANRGLALASGLLAISIITGNPIGIGGSLLSFAHAADVHYECLQKTKPSKEKKKGK